MSISSNIKRLRRDKGWTQAQLAKHSGVGLNQVSKLERGAADPRLSTLYKLINAFGCSPDTLLMDASQISLNASFKILLERIENLTDKEKEPIMEVLDCYLIAKGMEKAFSEENRTFMRIYMESPEKMLKSGAD